MKFLFGTVLISILALLLLACPKKETESEPTFFHLKNNSPFAFNYAISFKYPDVTLKGVEAKPETAASLINVGETEAVGRPDMFSINSTIQIFIIKSDSFNTKPWDTIVKKNQYFDRIEITKDNLKSMNWLINYP